MLSQCSGRGSILSRLPYRPGGTYAAPSYAHSAFRALCLAEYLEHVYITGWGNYSHCSQRRNHRTHNIIGCCVPWLCLSMVHVMVVLVNYFVGLGILGCSIEDALLLCSNLMHFVLIFLFVVLLDLILPFLVGGCTVADVGVDCSSGTDSMPGIVVVVAADFVVTAS